MSTVPDAPRAPFVLPGPEVPRASDLSVVITCYNAAWCIERALDSVFAQTVVPGEVLVSDDGSTDDTVARITERYGDAVRLLPLPHRGLTPSRVAAIEASRGSWFAIMDADDSWLPEKTERQLAFLARHPDVRWLSSDGSYVSADGVIAESWLAGYFDPVRDLVGDLYPYIVQRCFPLVSSSLVNREAYLAVGGMDLDVELSQDYALWLRLAGRFPGAVMQDRLTTYWSSPNQLSRRLEERYRDDLRLMERVARGEYRRDPDAQRIAREKIAAFEFELGRICLRSGRYREGRSHLRRTAALPGPWQRRALSLFGAALPRTALRHLMRSRWIKDRVQRARRRTPVFRPGGEDAS